jgi:hypothetical protein
MASATAPFRAIRWRAPAPHRPWSRPATPNRRPIPLNYAANGVGGRPGPAPVGCPASAVGPVGAPTIGGSVFYGRTFGIIKVLVLKLVAANKNLDRDLTQDLHSSLNSSLGEQEILPIQVFPGGRCAFAKFGELQAKCRQSNWLETISC